MTGRNRNQGMSIAKVCMVMALLAGAIVLTVWLTKQWCEQNIAAQKREYFYQSMLAFTLRQDANMLDQAMVFIGDSQVQGLAVSRLSRHAINLGIGGDTSTKLLERWPHYQSLQNAKLIFVAVGINDLFQSQDENLVKNMASLIAMVPSSTSIYIGAILPLAQTSKHFSTFQARIEKQNAALQKLSAQHANVNFVDYYADFVEADTKTPSNPFLVDGLHLNPTGYELMITKLKQILFTSEQ
jgi:lysophospholipase L1-like esterase